MKKSILFVGGVFDEDGGRPSSYFRKLVYAMSDGFDVAIYNGGHFSKLAQIIACAHAYDFVVWMADVPNDKPKLLPLIKDVWPKAILITSKRNDGKYTFKEIIFKALHAKANLLVEYQKGSDGLYKASVYDPLGNTFGMGLETPESLSAVLVKRMMFLAGMTRQQSICDGPELPVPDHPEFFGHVRRYAEKFHELIHAGETSRLLGNVSFRCEGGFPSFRNNEVVFVSKRNMDKRMIGVDGFVAVDLYDAEQVRYCGEVKPSVDAAIQTALYRYIPWAKYMLHSHVYVEGAPFTKRAIPCGALEEVEEITEVFEAESFLYGFGDAGKRSFRVNLRGHGSTVIGETEDCFADIPYIARSFPEAQE